MIKHIFTLKQSLGNRHLYVWGTGQKSMWIVLRFALRCVKVSGFVSAVPRFVSETILGLPVISPSDLSSDENAVSGLFTGVFRSFILPDAPYPQIIPIHPGRKIEVFNLYLFCKLLQIFFRPG